jgi:Flp pilus assembly pilin Flp
MLKNFLGNKSGATAIEYGLIAALVVILLGTALTMMFGTHKVDKHLVDSPAAESSLTPPSSDGRHVP